MDLAKLDAQQKLDMIDWVRCGLALQPLDLKWPVRHENLLRARLAHFVDIVLTQDYMPQRQFEEYDEYMKKGKDMDPKKTHL